MAGGSLVPTTAVAKERELRTTREESSSLVRLLPLKDLYSAMTLEFQVIPSMLFLESDAIHNFSSLYIAGLVASLLASPVTMKYGRKKSIMCSGISFLVGAALNAAAFNLSMLLFGRIMLGVGIGFGNQVTLLVLKHFLNISLWLKAVPLYLSEMAPTHLRGGLNMLFQLATTLGIFTANMIDYGASKIHPWGWRLSLGLAAVPACLMMTGGLLLPETPNNLIERGPGEIHQTPI